MRKQYQFSLTVIGFLVLICISILIGYKVYRHSQTEIVQVQTTDHLSINYFGTTNLKVKKQVQTLRFSVTNNFDIPINYQVNMTEIKNFTSKVNIKLNDGTQKIVIPATPKPDVVLIASRKIEPNQTDNFILKIDNPTKQIVSFNLLVLENTIDLEDFAKTIINDNKVQQVPLSQILTEPALKAEGLIMDSDDLSPTYYFRGAVTNNYVKLGKRLWRIVRINGDGTIRLVLDTNLETVYNYTSNPTDYSFRQSDLKKFLDEWYELELKAHDDLIVMGKYCDNLNIQPNSEFYNTYTRIYVNKLVSFNCLGEQAISKVGLLTIDEVIYAGSNLSKNNRDFYLYNQDSQSFWTMSAARVKSNNYYPFLVTKEGKVTMDTESTLNRGVRPVINLAQNLKVKGQGTKDDPYVIVSDQNSN